MEINSSIESESKRSKTLEELEREDRMLREKLGGQFDDDDRFQSLREEAIRYLEGAGSLHAGGIDRARHLAAAEAVLGTLQETKRGRASREFMMVNEKRERAQHEVGVLNAPQIRGPIHARRGLHESGSLGHDVERAVMENYWRRIETTGRHVLALSVEDIAEALCREHDCSADEIKDMVLNAILESPEPADLRPEALDVISDAIRRGEQVFIWTVGDEGSYLDTERHVMYPEYNFQRRKIEQSGIMEKLEERRVWEGGEAREVREKIFFNIDAQNKIESLREIFEKLKKDGVTDVFVVDDQQGNIRDALALQKDFPEVRIHDYWLNNASERGNIAAFKEYVAEQHRLNAMRSVAFVIDWDDTVYDEAGRMRRVVEELQGSFAL